MPSSRDHPASRVPHGVSRASLALVGIVVGAALVTAVGAAWAADATAAPVVNCKTRTQLVPPARNPAHIPARLRRQSVFAGPVMFSGAKSWSDPAFVSEDSFTRPGRWQSAKVAIRVNAGHVVRLKVSPPAGHRALISVGRDRGGGTRGRKVELRPCHPNARVAGNRVGRSTPFANAFKLDEKMCLRVKVKVKGRREPYFRRIGFGPLRCERPIALTRSEGSFPKSCSPARIGTRLESFARALREVDARTLRRYWDWPGFKRFSILRGERRAFVARSYARGLERLRRRGGVKLRIDELQVAFAGARIEVAFEGAFRTKGGNLTNLSATGRVACRRPGIARMSVRVGAEVPDVAACPTPSEDAPAGAMVVCTGAVSP